MTHLASDSSGWCKNVPFRRESFQIMAEIATNVMHLVQFSAALLGLPLS